MLGAMLDLSRNGVMKPNEVCRFADVLKKSDMILLHCIWKLRMK